GTPCSSVVSVGRLWGNGAALCERRSCEQRRDRSHAATDRDLRAGSGWQAETDWGGLHCDSFRLGCEESGAPELMAQLFHYFESPNGFGLPAFYTLHVWAWKDNPNGAFVNWHPKVPCQAFNPAQ